jgi:hypothetical protein
MDEITIEIPYGDRWRVQFGPAADESDPSLSGETVEVTIAKNYGDVALITKDQPGAGITYIDQAAGTYYVEFYPQDYDNIGGVLGSGEYKLNARITSPPEAVRTVRWAKLVVVNRVR